MATPSTFRACVIIALFLALVPAAPAAAEIDQSNLPEWAGGWTHVNPAGDGQAVMWQTFTPTCTNLTAVEIDILTISPGRGDDVLTVEIAGDGLVLASAERAVEDGFDGLLRFEFPEAVPLVPEQLYELAVRDTGKTRFGWKYGPNTYERGSRYVLAQQQLGYDWFFRTYAWVESAATKYSGGTGEPNDPYQIATAADLIALGETPEDYDKHFVLTADIDLDPNLPGRRVFDRAVIAPDVNDVVDGFQGIVFGGVFDGDGHTISHLTIEGRDYLGLFGLAGSGASVSNLGLEAVEITGTGYCVGGLVGGSERARINASHSSGFVSGGSSVGGLVGYNGGKPFGGGNITTSYSNSSVSGTSGAGGLVGVNGGSITDCCSSGFVEGDSEVGGLVGSNQSSLRFRGYITRSYSTAAVSAGKTVGGLVGYNGGNGNNASITSCYSSGPVSGSHFVGGLVGYNDFWSGVVIKCYSSSAVSGEYIGGLLGSGGGDEVVASFWDIQTSGQTAGDGGTGKTTAEMQTAVTFLDAGWDFVDDTENGPNDVWKIAEGLDYPRLWWEPYDGRVTAVLGQVFTVTLESNSSTGYRWEWVDHQDSIVAQMGEAQFKPRETGDPPLVGAGGWESFDFMAVDQGQMTLKLVYRRPWEEGVEPLKTFSLQVTVPQADLTP